MLKKYFSLNPWIILGIIVVFELVLSLLLKSTLLTEKVLYNSLVEQMTLEDISTFSSSIQSTAWLFVAYGVIQRILEMVLISVCITTGALLFRYNITFRQIISVVILAFLVFTVSRIPIFISLLSGNVEKFEDLTYIPMLSLAEWIGPDAVPEWALYPLQLFNLYQLIFILLMAAGFNLKEPRGYFRWLALTLITYGIGLAIIVVITGFITNI